MKGYLEMLKRLSPNQADRDAAAGMTSHWAQLAAQFDLLAAKLSTALAPWLNWLTDKIGAIVEGLAHWIEKNPDLAAGITALLAVLAGVKIFQATKNVLALKDALLALGAANAAVGGGGLLGLLARISPYIAGLLVAGAVMAPGGLNEGEDERARQREHGQGGGNGALRQRGSSASVGRAAQNANALAAIDEMRKAGLSNEAIAAAIGSMQTESSFNPRITNTSGHTGLIQWSPTRWAKIAAWIRSQGGDPMDARWQTRAFIAEGRAKPGDAIYDGPGTSRGFRELENAKGDLDRAIRGMGGIERFDHEGGRGAHARAWLPIVSGTQPSTIADIARAANPPGSHQGKPLPMPANMGPLWKGGERMPAFVQMRQAALNNIANTTTATTTSSSNELHVNGGIHVNAPSATDAHGIARHIDSALAASLFADAANYGPN